MARPPSPTHPRPAAPPPRPAARPGAPGSSDDIQASGAEAQLALCEPDHLRRLEQPLKYGFADRSSARKGLEVAAGVAIADRLGSIRQTAGPPIGRHGYMAIVWLGSRWLQLEQAAASAVPFTQYRLLHDFGWEESGKNARQALKRTLLNLQEARWEGEVNDSVSGKKTHEDHFGIIDRVLWPVVQDGRLERLGYIFLGSWFLEQLRHEAGVYIDWDVLRDLPPIARKLYGLLENDRFEEGEDGEEWQAYWLGAPLFASVGSTCARERDNVAAVARACEAIASHPGTGYRFSRERVAVDGAWCSSWSCGARPAAPGGVCPRLLRAPPPAEGASERRGRLPRATQAACMRLAPTHRARTRRAQAGRRRACRHEGEHCKHERRRAPAHHHRRRRQGRGREDHARLRAGRRPRRASSWISTGMPAAPPACGASIRPGRRARRSSTAWSAGPRGGCRA